LRWQDSVIYFTHRVPNEPTFSTATIAANGTPLPLAAIHSTSDEFVASRGVGSQWSRGTVESSRSRTSLPGRSSMSCRPI